MAVIQFQSRRRNDAAGYVSSVWMGDENDSLTGYIQDADSRYVGVCFPASGRGIVVHGATVAKVKEQLLPAMEALFKEIYGS